MGEISCEWGKCGSYALQLPGWTLQPVMQSQANYPYHLGMSTTYETDVAAWADEQAMLLRSGNLTALDVEHLAEEMAAMSAKEKRELRSRLAVLLQHLLKWQFQPLRRSDSWTTTMFEHRLNISGILEDSPSLSGVLEARLDSAYGLAVHQAAKDTGISVHVFECGHLICWASDQVT